MAHARIIRQTFYNDPLIADRYNIEERYLLIGLACYADDYGKFWNNLSNIHSVIFPTDDELTPEWIGECLNKLESDSVLCMYSVDGIKYGHFPKWFVKGWFLKQKIDHPREFQHPDCPICRTEQTKRETSRAIKGNSIKRDISKKKERKDKIKDRFKDPYFFKRLIDKYEAIDKNIYSKIMNGYINQLSPDDINEIEDHERELEKLLLREQGESVYRKSEGSPI